MTEFTSELDVAVLGSRPKDCLIYIAELPVENPDIHWDRIHRHSVGHRMDRIKTQEPFAHHIDPN
jgi:hypothetical protein